MNDRLCKKGTFHNRCWTTAACLNQYKKACPCSPLSISDTNQMGYLQDCRYE